MLFWLYDLTFCCVTGQQQNPLLTLEYRHAAERTSSLAHQQLLKAASTYCMTCKCIKVIQVRTRADTSSNSLTAWQRERMAYMLIAYTTTPALFSANGMDLSVTFRQDGKADACQGERTC